MVLILYYSFCYFMRIKAFILLIALGFLWGSGYAIARYCVTHGVTPLGYSFWQSLGPALLLSLLALLQRKFRLQMLNAKLLGFALMAGFLGIAVPNSIMYFASQHLPASMVATLVNTVPLFIYPLALLLQVEQYRGSRLAWILLAVLGLVLLNFVPHDFTHTYLPWSLLVLGAPLSFALCAILIQPLQPQDLDALGSASLMLVVSSMLLTPIVFFKADFYGLQFQHPVDFWILLEILLSSLGYVLFFQLIKLAGPVYYSLTGGAVALTGICISLLVFKETLGIRTVIALLLILLAIFGMSYSQNPRSPTLRNN